MSQNLSSAAVVIGALRVKQYKHYAYIPLHVDRISKELPSFNLRGHM